MAAIPLVDTGDMDMTGYEDLMDLDVSSFRIMSIGDLSTDIQRPLGQRNRRDRMIEFR